VVFDHTGADRQPQSHTAKGLFTPIIRAWRAVLPLGGHVRKGEHGTKVYFVKQLQVRDQRADDSSETRLIPMMREYTVFNVDQCENLPDNINTGTPIRVRNPDTRDELADAFLQTTGADIREGHGEAFYVPSRDAARPHLTSSNAAIGSLR
jgi:antirestriction protein ArdC